MSTTVNSTKHKIDTTDDRPLKKIKLSGMDDLDDLFENKNQHTLEPKKASKSAQKIKHVNRLLIQFITRDNKKEVNPIDVPIGFTPDKLQFLLNTLLNQNDDPTPYSFYYDHSINYKNDDNMDKESNNNNNNNNDLITNINIDTSLRKFIINHNDSNIKNKRMQIDTENILHVIYEPQSLFRVQPVSRCTSNLPGHTEAILSVCFRPDCMEIASGSGDSTIRLWNVLSQTPGKVLKSHKHHVMCVEYSPTGDYLASGDKNGWLILWNVKTGYKVSRYPIKDAHDKCVTSISWKPYFLCKDGKCEYIVTAGDTTIKIWNTRTRQITYKFNGHTKMVTKVIWGGQDFIYSASRDTTIRVWNPNNGTCVRILQAHAHWVNHICISTQYALKFGAFNRDGTYSSDIKQRILDSKKMYNDAYDVRGELLCSSSDDLTLFLWNPTETDKPVCRMHGHQQIVNHCSFSPDGRLIASASFDNSVRVWDGLTGKFIVRLIGHVENVYQICWSADSRMIASASKDSTVKLWNLKNNKLIIDLPGHADQVFALDWSPNGEYLCSGGKDTILRIWAP